MEVYLLVIKSDYNHQNTAKMQSGRVLYNDSYCFVNVTQHDHSIINTLVILKSSSTATFTYFVILNGYTCILEQDCKKKKKLFLRGFEKFTNRSLPV